MKSKKRLIAILLAIVLLIAAVTVVSFTVFASTNNCEHEEWNQLGNDQGQCTECGYIHHCVSEGHDYQPVESIDDNTHTEKCVICGGTATFNHQIEIGWKTDKKYHWQACACGYVIKRAEHSGTEEDFKDAYGDCESDGRCDICNAELAHRYKVSYSEKATCLESGSQTYKCINCGDIYKEEIKPTGHYWNGQYVDPVSGELTNSSKYCKFEWSEDYGKCTITLTCMHDCGATLTYSIARAGNVDNVISVSYVAPTCTVSGKTTYTALFTLSDITKYGWNISTDTFTDVQVVVEEAKGHTLKVDSEGNPIDKEVTKAATCGEDEVYTGVCSVCGEKMPNQVLEGSKAGIAHTPDIPTSTTESFNCEEGGTYESVTKCKICKTVLSTETVTVDKKAHTMKEDVITVEPSCTEDGYTTTITACAICNYEKSRVTKTLPATGHNVTDYTSTIPATCTEYGKLVGICDKCGIEVSVVNPSATPKGHNYVGSTAGKGCYSYCADCGDVRRNSKNHTDLDFDLTCDYCNSKIDFWSNWIHYIGAWPMYLYRLIAHLITGKNITA